MLHLFLPSVFALIFSVNAFSINYLSFSGSKKNQIQIESSEIEFAKIALLINNHFLIKLESKEFLKLSEEMRFEVLKELNKSLTSSKKLDIALIVKQKDQYSDLAGYNFQKIILYNETPCTIILENDLVTKIIEDFESSKT